MKNLTKDALAMVFVNMCEENMKLKDVRVKDFITHANISKQTFYNYFRDKADLMNYAYELGVSQIVHEMPATLEGVYIGALKMVTVCLEHKKFFMQLASYETQNNFLSHFIQHCEVIYKEKLAEKEYTVLVNAKLSRVIHVFCVGVCTYIVEWIQNGMKDSPDQVAEMITACMPSGIKEILES